MPRLRGWWELYGSSITRDLLSHSLSIRLGGLDLAIQTERVGGAKQQMEC